MTTFTIPSALLLALAATGVHAAELGEATVRSHAGEQLVADVELVDLTTPDLAELQARLASRDVFQGANVTMSPALAGLNISIVKRDQRRVLHLTTSAPVQSEVLHLYFELTSGGRQSVRGVSLWLPAAPPAPPAPVPQPTRIVAAPVAPVVPLPEPAPLPAPRPRPAGVAVQLAAAATPGKGATKVDAELLGAVERAFKARTAGKTITAEPPKEASLPPKTVSKAVVAAPEKAAPKAPEKKLAEKPPATQAPSKPIASIVPPLPVVAKPAAVPRKPEADPAVLKKLAELEAKLKTLQAMVASKAVAAPAVEKPARPAVVPPTVDKLAKPAVSSPAAPVAHAVAAAAPQPAAPAPVAAPTGQVAESAAVITATEPAGRTAAGKITDARIDKPTPAVQPNTQTAQTAQVNAAPAPEEPVKEKKMSRPKVLTMIAAGSAGLLLVIGIIVHFVRRRNARQATEQIKVWQTWRKKAIAEAATAEQEPEEQAVAP